MLTYRCVLRCTGKQALNDVIADDDVMAEEKRSPHIFRYGRATVFRYGKRAPSVFRYGKRGPAVFRYGKRGSVEEEDPLMMLVSPEAERQGWLIDNNEDDDSLASADKRKIFRYGKRSI